MPMVEKESVSQSRLFRLAEELSSAEEFRDFSPLKRLPVSGCHLVV